MLCWMFLSFIMPRSCSDLGGWKARNQVLLLESIQCLVNTPLQPGTRLGVKLLFRTEGNKEINLLQLVREGPIVVGGGASIVSLSLYLAMPYFLNAPNYHQVTGQLHGNQFLWWVTFKYGIGLSTMWHSSAWSTADESKWACKFLLLKEGTFSP